MRSVKFINRTIVFIFLICMFGCHSHLKDEAVIHGQLTGLIHSRLYLFQLLPDSMTVMDSTVTDNNGNFTFLVCPKETSFYILRQSPRNYITIAANKGENILIEGNGRNLMNSYTIKGSKESEVLWEFNSIASKNQVKIDSLSNRLKESQSLREFPVIRNKLDSTFSIIYEANRRQVLSFLTRYTSSLASVIIVNCAFGGTPVVTMDNDLPLLSAIDTALAQRYRSNRNYIAFHSLVNKSRKDKDNPGNNLGCLSPGTMIPEIILPDAAGKLKKLSFVKGKMTLLYFWASWNEASRDMNAGLAGLYEQFHAKGLEVAGISLDQDRKSWITACQRDRTSWVQIIDSSGLKSHVAKSFMIGNLPAALLIDREGKVISGDMKLPELKALLLEKL